MSRLWDTPEFWARSNADDLLLAHPERDVRAVAKSLLKEARLQEDPDLAKATASELHKRAEAGIRYWPEVVELAALEYEVRGLLTSVALLKEPSVFWWQKM